MNQIKFRTARMTDLPAVVALLADDPLGAMREVHGSALDARYITAFKAIEADPNQQLVVVTSEEHVVGTLQLSFIPGIARAGVWRGQIEAVRISAQHRGSGVGQKMIEWAISECKNRGCQIVQLTTDKQRVDAHRFYEKLGFVASHEGYKLILDSI